MLCASINLRSEASLHLSILPTPSPSPTSLYLKRWLMMLGPCVFIYLLSKPSRVLALEWEKAPRVRPFAERGWRFGWGGAACWLEHADKMLFSRGSPWTQRLKGLTESEKQTDSLFFYRQRKKWMCGHYTDTRPWVPVVFESKVSFVSVLPFTGKAHFERRDLVYREWLHDLILA